MLYSKISSESPHSRECFAQIQKVACHYIFVRFENEDRGTQGFAVHPMNTTLIQEKGIALAIYI